MHLWANWLTNWNKKEFLTQFLFWLGLTNSFILWKTPPFHWLYQHRFLTGVKLKDYVDQRSQLSGRHKFSENSTKPDSLLRRENQNITHLKVKSHSYNTKEVRRIETNSIKAASIPVDSKSQTILGSESYHRDTKEGKKTLNDQYHKIIIH